MHVLIYKRGNIKFVYCLDTIAPPGTYFLFKTCLLLSLLIEGDKSVLNIEDNGGKQHNNNLHILVNNEDVLSYQRMLLYASKFSESPVVHRVPMDLFGSITEDNSLTYVDGRIIGLLSVVYLICYVLLCFVVAGYSFYSSWFIRNVKLLTTSYK